LLLALTVACGADTMVSVAADSRSQTLSVAVGQELHVTLGNVGPAQYASPPQISSAALTFLGVEVIPPFTPAGPTQQFHFRASNRGVAILQFRRVLGDSVVSAVEDTVQVR
jgi:hypothetical protein